MGYNWRDQDEEREDDSDTFFSGRYPLNDFQMLGKKTEETQRKKRKELKEGRKEGRKEERKEKLEIKKKSMKE